MKKEDFVIEVSTTLNRLTILFSNTAFDITDFKSINQSYYFSIITEILIHMKDLTQKLNNLGNRIDFKDHIEPCNYYTDITDLLAYFRDAACHNDSGKRRNYNGYLFAGNVFAAYDFEDDITLLMGDAKLLVNRHLVRTYKIILQKFASYTELYENDSFIQALGYARFQKAI